MTIVTQEILPVRVTLSLGGSGMNLREIVGKNVRELRKKRGISQADLASAAGLETSYVGRIERGTTNVSLDVLGRLAIALHLPVPRLLMEAPQSGADAAARLRRIADEIEVL